MVPYLKCLFVVSLASNVCWWLYKWEDCHFEILDGGWGCDAWWENEAWIE